MIDENPYRLLGVAENADDATIKQAYLQQVRAHPPERDPQRFQSIRTAFELIHNRRQRLRFRLFLDNPSAPAAGRQLLTDQLDEAIGSEPRAPQRPTLTQVCRALAEYDPWRPRD